MRFFLFGLGICVAAAPFAHAQLGSSNMVRQAAIERLQSKLGTIRGTLKGNDHLVFLTEEMIEQLKPIRISKREELQTVTPKPAMSGLVTTAGGSSVSMSEINSIAGITSDTPATAYDMGTTAGVIEGPDPMDEILKLADKIAAGQ